MWRRGVTTYTPSGDDDDDDSFYDLDFDDDYDDNYHHHHNESDDPDVQAYHLHTFREYGGLLERAGFTQVRL